MNEIGIIWKFSQVKTSCIFDPMDWIQDMEKKKGRA
jgi:hypothetical protein